MELQKLLQDEIREGLYRITISGPRGDSEVSKVRIRPVEIKGKLLFQCQETVGTKEFHKNMTKDDVITRISDWMNGTFKQMQLESDTCTASVLVSKKGTMTIKKKPHMKGTGKPVNLAHNRKKRYILEEGIPVPFLQDLGVMTKEGKNRADPLRQVPPDQPLSGVHRRYPAAAPIGPRDHDSRFRLRKIVSDVCDVLLLPRTEKTGCQYHRT